MVGKTGLITGATGGIGKATALGLAGMGAHLAIIGRDRGRTDAAAQELQEAGVGPGEGFVGDLFPSAATMGRLQRGSGTRASTWPGRLQLADRLPLSSTGQHQVKLAGLSTLCERSRVASGLRVLGVGLLIPMPAQRGPVILMSSGRSPGEQRRPPCPRISP